MKASAPISMTVHYPEAEEGKRALARRAACIRADMVLNSIAKLDCPAWQKERLLNAVIQAAKERLKAGQS